MYAQRLYTNFCVNNKISHDSNKPTLNSQLGCEILKYMHHKKLHVTRPHSSIKNELQFCLILQHFIKTEIKPLIQMTGHLMILTAFDGLNDIEMKRYQFHINGNVHLILQFYIIFSIFLPIVKKNC